MDFYPKNVLSIDVEDWFHILDSPVIPSLDQWDRLESRVAKNTEKLLLLLSGSKVKATFFWLGWAAERNKALVRTCIDQGHEVASHGYAHLLAYKVSPDTFAADIRKARMVLEDITGHRVIGFRAAGFSTKNDTRWTFEQIRKAGYLYDSSVFPSSRGHGGMTDSQLAPYVIKTKAGDLIELPQSMVKIFGKRVSLFGGGYLRLAPAWLIKWGINKLHNEKRPLIIYVHPREIDPQHPQLPLNPVRRFKSYVNLKSTMPKLTWICKGYQFCTMRELVSDFSHHDICDELQQEELLLTVEHV